MKLLTPLNTQESYKKFEFEFTPKTTYIGVNHETLKLTFPDKNLLVSATNTSLVISNSETSITIKETSDAVPEDVDLFAKGWAYFVGAGSIATLIASLIIRVIFGVKFNLGWGLINFIQIIAFIPLADFYFPGNVRGFVSVLKLANTVGAGFFNPFYFFIDRDSLNMEPYNSRFELMGIKTTVFIENFGFQLFVFLGYFAMIPVATLAQKILIKKRVKNKVAKFIVNGFYDFFSINTIVKMMIILYMFAFLSALMTLIDLNFANGHEAASFALGAIAFLFLILMIFAIFTVIQRYHKKMEDGNLDEKRMASIIGDIDYTKKTCARFYIPLYLLRRAVFMTLVLIFDYDLKFFCFSLLLAH
jgi:fumarate reductase subunit D